MESFAASAGKQRPDAVGEAVEATVRAVVVQAGQEAHGHVHVLTL